MGLISIALVYQDQYPWDIRIEKFHQALSERGYSVHIISKNSDGVEQKKALSDNVHIHRLYGGNPRILRSIANYPAFFSPFWLYKILQVIRQEKIGLLIVRDLPLSPTAILAGRMTGIPVVMDMAENYPAMIRDTWTFRGPKPMDYLIRNPILLRFLEKIVVNALDGIIVVSDASRSRVEGLLKRNVPVWVVGNTPRLQYQKKILDHPLKERIQSFAGLKLLYVGGMENSRGLDVVIEAIRDSMRDGIKVLFIIVGKGESEDRLREISDKYCLQKSIFFAGYVEQRYIPSIISDVDVCIVPHYVTEHTNTTIPNKIYDYMVQGKPVLVTQAETLKTIVEENRCGYVYQDKDPRELAAHLWKLADPAHRKSLGNAGYEAIREKYNWDMDKIVLLDVVSHDLRKNRRMGTEF